MTRLSLLVIFYTYMRFLQAQDPYCLTGVYGGCPSNTCCNSCCTGGCGGGGCETFGCGSSNCCSAGVAQTLRVCHLDGPPCVVSERSWCDPPVFQARFPTSCDFREVEIRTSDIHIKDLIVAAAGGGVGCGDIFDTDTAAMLGSDAVCSLSTEWASYEDTLLTVQLAGTSTIPRDANLTIRSGVWEWFRVTGREHNSAISLPFEDPCPVSARTPIIDLYVSPEFGICDSLELDLRAGGLSNLGGRAPDLFAYNISLLSAAIYVENEKYVVVESDRIEELETGTYVLSVRSWLGETTTQSSGFTKLDIPIPSIRLAYPTIFDAYTDVVHIGSVIAFNAACLDPPIAGTFVYLWEVEFAGMINGSAPFNASMFAALQLALHENEDASLTVAHDGEMLQKGASYAFVLTAECAGMNMSCTVVSRDARISYQYSPISCQIAGGDKTLNVSLADVGNLTLEFDGATYTFDPDGNALVFEWQCYDEMSALDCSHWFASNVTLPTNRIRFNRSWYSNATSVSYGYTIMLVVSDADIASRASCVNSVAVVLNIIEPVETDKYLLSLATTSTSVSKADTIRLIASFTYLNGSQVVSGDDDFLFEWSTVDEAMTIAQIASYRLNDANYKNLVLDAAQLEMGATYTFVLNVYPSADATEVSLARSAVSVYVTTEPFIYDDGFLVDPVLCTRAFDYFIDALFYPFSVFVTAEAQETPITFAFTAQLASSQATYYLHSSVLFQASLRAFLLPVDDDIELLVTVTDFAGASVSTTMQCGLSVTNLNHDNDCFSYTSAVLDAYFASADPDNLFSAAQTYAYVLQSSFSLLHYLRNIDGADCRFEHFSETMTALDSYFGPSAAADLCSGSDVWFVVELAQTLTEWLTVGTANDENGFFATFYSEPCTNFDVVYTLLVQVLDPCGMIRDTVVDSNRLLVTQDSVITNRIIVLYDDVDITAQLSVLLTHTQHFPLLYNVMRAYLASLSALNAMDADCLDSIADVSSIFSFVERVLLVSGVSSISVTIPSEFTNFRVPNLEVLTIRDEQISTVNVTVNNVPVSMVKNSNSEVGANDDLIMYGVTQNTKASVNYSGSDTAGTLGDQIVSINFVNSTVNDGDVDVNMTFNVSDRWSELERAQCVWWNSAANMWDAEGCRAMFYLVDETMECRCSHLTTFAIIYHLKVSDADSSAATDPIKLAIQNEPLYGTVMLAFGISFLCLLMWIALNVVRVRTYDLPMSKILSEVSMRILLLVAFLCLIQAFICMMSFSYKYVDFDASKSLILFLLLSLFVYYVVFTIIVTTWMSIAHSMHQSDAILRFKKAIKYSSLFVLLVLFVLFVLLVFSEDDASVVVGINVGAIVWVVMMTLWVLLSSVYGYKVTALLYKSNQAVADARMRKANNTHNVLKRIGVAIIGLNVFFLVQCVQTIYFTVDPGALTVGWRLFDLVAHFLCLASICFLYHRSFNSLLVKEGRMEPSSIRTGSSSRGTGSSSGKSSSGKSSKSGNAKHGKTVRTFSAESTSAATTRQAASQQAGVTSTVSTETEMSTAAANKAARAKKTRTLTVESVNDNGKGRKVTDFDDEEPTDDGALPEMEEYEE